MEHTLIIDDEEYELLKSGSLELLYRMFDEEMYECRLGDILILKPKSNSHENIQMYIQDREIFNSMEHAISYRFEERLQKIYEDKNKALIDIYRKNNYDRMLIRQYGVVVIHLKEMKLKRENNKCLILQNV